MTTPAASLQDQQPQKQPPRSPFRSARLVFRAVSPADDAFFAQINDDHIGYVNGNASNITLPGPEQATAFRQSMAGRLLAAVCHPLPSPPSIPLPALFPPLHSNLPD